MRKPRTFSMPSLLGSTTVYECLETDFGCALEESLESGVPHLSVTLEPSGEYPFFTCPMTHLREIQ